MLQSQYYLRPFPLRRVQLDSANFIPIQHRAHVHIVKSKMIVIPPREHFLLPLRAHPLSVVLHAKDEIPVFPRACDRNASAAFCHLDAMLYRIFH